MNTPSEPLSPPVGDLDVLTEPAARASLRSVPRALLREMRPRQWTKNLVILAPLLFSLNLRSPSDALRAAATAALFCLVSGGVYILNDLHDLERDRLDDVRSRRPLAAGELSRRAALAAAAAALLAGVGGVALLDRWLAPIVLGYVVLQVCYTLWLKHEVVLDVMAIAAGFMLRVSAGAVVIHVAVSPWLYSCAGLLALFLGLAKRRQEVLLRPDYHEHRPVLRAYTVEFLDQGIGVVAAATIAVYSMYTFLSSSADTRPYLMLTIPFVVYGLLRYMYLIHARQQGDRPEEVLLRDLPLVVDLVTWAAVAVAVLYLT